MKTLLKVQKSLFSDKSTSGDKTKITENGEHVKTKNEDNGSIKQLFLKYSKESLKIPDYSNFDLIVQSIQI